MFHSVEQDIIYLNLVSIHDTVLFMAMIDKLEETVTRSVRAIQPHNTQTERCALDFHLLLEKKEYHHLKAMLFMFHVCHLILVSIIY